jgi:hypothetical protein
MLDMCFNELPDKAFRLEMLSSEKETIWELAANFTAMEVREIVGYTTSDNLT